MKIQESAENYLEAILMIKERNGEVRSVDIVNELGFSKPSISVAMKNLRQNGYITMDAKGFIELTEKGFDIANTMYERHNYNIAVTVSGRICLSKSARIVFLRKCRSLNFTFKKPFQRL